MFLSDLLFQAVIALVWSLVGIPFNIFNGVATTILNSALGL